MAKADWDISNGFRNSSKSISPGCTGGIAVGNRRRTSGRIPADRLVVIRDFDFVGIALLPAETDSILFIDADTVLTAPISLKSLQSVVRWHGKLSKVSDSIELRQLAADNRPQHDRTGRPRSTAIDTIEKVFGSRVRKGAYHSMYYNGYRRYAPYISCPSNAPAKLRRNPQIACLRGHPLRTANACVKY